MTVRPKGPRGDIVFGTQVGRTVLRVKDFTWHPGYMELVEAELDEAIRGEVKLRRVKRHYHERSYGYEMSVTPDALEVARRAATKTTGLAQPTR